MRCFSVVLTLVFLAMPVVEAADSRPFTLCYEDQHYPPFIQGTGQPEGMGHGILIDYIMLASERLNQPVIFERKPWKRCQMELKQGVTDAIFAAIYTDERDLWAAFPKTNGQPDQRFLHSAQYPIFVGQPSTLNWDGTRFTPERPRVQAPPGYVADAQLRAMGIQPSQALNPDKALPLLAAQRLDGFVMEAEIGESLVRELGFAGRITTLPVPFIEQPWYLAFSKQRYAEDAALIETFWTVISEIRVREGAAIERLYDQP